MLMLTLLGTHFSLCATHCRGVNKSGMIVKAVKFHPISTPSLGPQTLTFTHPKEGLVTFEGILGCADQEPRSSEGACNSAYYAYQDEIPRSRMFYKMPYKRKQYDVVDARMHLLG